MTDEVKFFISFTENLNFAMNICHNMAAPQRKSSAGVAELKHLIPHASKPQCKPLCRNEEYDYKLYAD